MCKSISKKKKRKKKERKKKKTHTQNTWFVTIKTDTEKKGGKIKTGFTNLKHHLSNAIIPFQV